MFRFCSFLAFVCLIFGVSAAPAASILRRTVRSSSTSTWHPSRRYTNESDIVCGYPLSYAECDTSGRSTSNCNPYIDGLYPIATSSSDPTYTFPEDAYRSAIHLPSTFNRSQPAVILFPGTTLPTFDTYAPSVLRLLTEDGLNPVLVNPGFEYTQLSTADAQVTSEFAAYAINYVAEYTGRNVSIVGVSQGSMNVQWALKYWKSARSHTSDFVAVSGDFKGTHKFGAIAIASLVRLLCGPACNLIQSAWQQTALSRFSRALNARGGSSALVPTTSVWSSQDEVIEPASGIKRFISAFLQDKHGAGFTGVEVQEVCRENPKGNTAPPAAIHSTAYSHIGLMVHPLLYTVLKDAVTHEGPAWLERIGADEIERLCTHDGVADPRLPESVINDVAALGEMAACLGTASVFDGSSGEVRVADYAEAPA